MVCYLSQAPSIVFCFVLYMNKPTWSDSMICYSILRLYVKFARSEGWVSQVKFVFIDYNPYVWNLLGIIETSRKKNIYLAFSIRL